MGKSNKWRERNSEIVTFFYMIFGHRIRLGEDQRVARREAYDAVSLRYGVERGRLLNIISEKNYSHSVNTILFIEDAKALICDLKSANKEMKALQERNEKLIAFLKECLDDEAGR